MFSPPGPRPACHPPGYTAGCCTRTPSHNNSLIPFLLLSLDPCGPPNPKPLTPVGRPSGATAGEAVTEQVPVGVVVAQTTTTQVPVVEVSTLTAREAWGPMASYWPQW